MSIFAILAATCLVASVALWKASFSFTNDAGQVGSVMLAASVVLFATFLFLFGVVVGKLSY